MHLALFRPEFPVLGGCSRPFGSAHSVRQHCSRHLNSRWRGRALCRDGAPNSRELLQPRESCASPARAAPAPRELRQPRENSAASSPDENPVKQPRPQRENVYSRAGARATLFFNRRIKLSFASALNSISFYWPEQQQAEGPLLGTRKGQ